ncbi:MAG: hypothetical protein VB118_11090 [Oscillospiraceae bacterium]|nr:hypothetical protein [Oscillospiraceae bacterium]
MLEYKISEYSVYGKCLFVKFGAVELISGLALGPRILSLKLGGGQNVFYNDVDFKTHQDGDVFKAVFGKDSFWRLYGGHRLWASPEIMPVTYYPDNDQIEYNINGNTLSLSQRTQRVTGMKLDISLKFGYEKNENSILVSHRIENTLDEQKKITAWALSVMAPGGRAEIPAPEIKSGLLPNRAIAMWPYASLDDPRLSLSGGNISVGFDKNKEPFKLGATNLCGLCRYYAPDKTIFEKASPFIADAEYPDFGCSCEIYTCPDFTELETLSPLYTLKKGESIIHNEIWTLSK